MMRALFLPVVMTLSLALSPAAWADDPGISGGSDESSLWVKAKGRTGADDASVPSIIDSSNKSGKSPYDGYKWTTVCVRSVPATSNATDAACGVASLCPEATEQRLQLWGHLAESDQWEALATRCSSKAPDAMPTPKPQVTPSLVLTELRRIGLPSLQARTQPRDKTLVNFATIFYAEPQTFTRTLTLLGQSVDVEATPTSFTWHYGDGSSATTSTPGAPYPAKDVTHSYTDAHTTVQPSVDVTYSARFRVGNGAWQTIPDTVTIAGPAGTLRISEATAVLSGEYH